MREVHRQPIVYVANILVLCYARYNLRYHLHLETLFLVSAIYFFELLQRSLTDDSFDTFTIFIYFNVKVAVIIFQAFIDNYWYNVRNTEYVALGFFFFFGRILVQFYYTQAREYQPQNWDVVFWTGLTMEALACWRMFYILMLHNSLPDTRMSDVIGRNLRTNAADQQRNVLADTDSKGDDSKAPKIQNDEQVNVSAEKDSKGDGNKDSAIQCPASQCTADHVQEEVLYMAGKHIYFIFFANVSIAISCILSSIVVFQRDKYIDDLLDDYSSDNCNSDSRSYFGFAGIFMNLSFALLIHGQYIFASENYGFGRNFSSENAYELFKPWHCFLVVLYLCLQIFYFIIRAYDFTWCPNKYDQNGLILESIRGTVCYFLSSLVVIFGHYVTHGRTYMQLETLYLYTVVLFFDFVQDALTDHHFGNHAVFIYFNVKFAVLIYEIFVDDEWIKLQSWWKMLLGLLFFIGRVLVQFYYNQPGKYLPDNWIVFYCFGVVLQIISTFFMVFDRSLVFFGLNTLCVHDDSKDSKMP